LDYVELKKTLSKHFMFVYDQVSAGSRKEVELFINPEEFSQTEPTRISVTQTKGGAFVDYFGQGIRTISIKGITGFKSRKVGSEELSGHDQFLNLRTLIRDWTTNSKIDPKDHILYLFNFADSEFYEIIVNNFQLLRSVGRSLLYQFNIAITCIRECGTKGSNLVLDQNQIKMDNALLNPEERVMDIATATEYELDSMEIQPETEEQYQMMLEERSMGDEKYKYIPM